MIILDDLEYHLKKREEEFQALMNDEEAISALKILIEKGYHSPAIKGAYFCIKEDMENEK